MLFQLPSFLLFFLIFCGLFAVCPKRLHLPFVAAASLIFYAWWYPPYVLLLIAMVGISWLLLRLVHRDRRWLTAAVLVSLIPLVLFKYTDFVLRTVGALAGFDPPRLGWALPLGVSFVTFTIISYLIDTARQPAEKPPGLWPTTVYLTFFPHLIAGPILRAHHILPQLPHIRLDRAALMPNLALFAAGMLKKVLIADPVGAFVDRAYQAHATLGGGEALAAIFGFAIQIYCDFSAYSDMAIALAGLLGVSFPENFHSPYASASMGEIWRRWHMTLSFWLRDYVFKPLHHRFYRHARQLSIVLTMTVSGLWHGAAWTFVLWGLAQGLIMALENASGYARFAAKARGATRGACVALTFLVWMFVTVLFRAPDLYAARDIYAALGHGGWSLPPTAVVPVLLGLALLAVHPIDQMAKIRAAATRIPAPLLAPVLIALIAGGSLVAAMHPQTFYYFDF